MAKTKPRKCFCGGTPQLRKKKGHVITYYGYECDLCGTSTEGFTDKGVAAEMWNGMIEAEVDKRLGLQPPSRHAD